MKNVTKITTLALLSASAFAGVASAGSLADAYVEPQVFEPVAAPAPVFTGGDWTGFYTGAQLGYGDIDGTSNDGNNTNDDLVDGDGGIYGLHAGYDYDFGRYVLGAEVDYDQANIDLANGVEVDSIARLKAKVGYDLGRTMVYATGGAARVDTSVGDETGPFLGLGVAYQVTDNFTLGGEVLGHKFDDIGGTGVEADATTATIRGSFRF